MDSVLSVDSVVYSQLMDMFWFIVVLVIMVLEAKLFVLCRRAGLALGNVLLSLFKTSKSCESGFII